MAKKIGRPPKFTLEALKDAITVYFGQIADDRSRFPAAPTKSGIILHLGITRETWSTWRDAEHPFSDTIKSADALIEEAWVQMLKRPQVAGIIFYLKNAFKEHYRDTYDHTSDGKPLPTPIYGGQSLHDPRHDGDPKDIPAQEEN